MILNCTIFSYYCTILKPCKEEEKKTNNKDKPTYESVQDETGLTVTYDGDSHFFPSGVTQPEHPYYEEALKAHTKGDIAALILLEVQAVREQIEAQAESADRTEK